MLIQYKMAVSSGPQWETVSVEDTAEIIRQRPDDTLIIDSRSFLEHNTCHLRGSVNVCCSKLVKRRLQQEKISILELLSQACKCDVEAWMYEEVIVYDQCTVTHEFLTDDCFLVVLIAKLKKIFNSVKFLKGGFLEFQAAHPSLCENKCAIDYKCSSLTSMSQPCLPMRNVGPTKILPFLYLGSQHDAFSQDCIKVNGISYILNVSTTCPKPAFIQDSYFLRIPVNDNYNDKLLPHFYNAFQFLDKVQEANGCVLVHCLAGISRSPTLAIAYVMKHLKMSSDDAYRYVKDKRPTISPNFNFLGQLLEFERQMKADSYGSDRPMSCLSPISSPDAPKTPTRLFERLKFLVHREEQPLSAQSPTTALARLTFSRDPPSPDIHQVVNFPTTSLDKLNFTPCFAREDANLQKRTSAVKRPLSTSLIDTGIGIPPEPEESKAVTLRSPELKVKRPLMRPNSIAFSRYPRYDFAASEPPSRVLSPAESKDDTATGTSPNGKEDREAASPLVSKRTCTQLDMNARKSRSLEDILASSDDDSPLGCECPHKRLNEILTASTVPTSCTGGASGVSNGGNCNGGDGKRDHSCRCTLNDPHQSNSSISSTGSRGSLQGSLEMIPVS